jgi:hypothetical protein
MLFGTVVGLPLVMRSSLNSPSEVGLKVLPVLPACPLRIAAHSNFQLVNFSKISNPAKTTMNTFNLVPIQVLNMKFFIFSEEIKKKLGSVWPHPFLYTTLI